MTVYKILHVNFFPLEFLSLQLQFLEIFLNIVALLCLFLDDLAAAGDASGEVINVALVHLALALVILLALEVFCEIIEEHLDRGRCTVILLLRG